MTALGIDLSLTSTGLARIYEDGRAYTWSRTSTGKRGDMLTQRVTRIRRLTMDIDNDTYDTDRVVIEAPSYGSRGGSTWDRAGLWWALIQLLVSRDLPVSLCAPATRAKWAAGTGRADKAAVAAAMARLFPNVEISNSDEADALALAHIGAVRAGYAVPTLARHDAAAMAKVHWGDAA
jgi:Holliday junction resolvasome RuvABC endonuclease subunit